MRRFLMVASCMACFLVGYSIPHASEAKVPKDSDKCLVKSADCTSSKCCADKTLQQKCECGEPCKCDGSCKVPMQHAKGCTCMRGCPCIKKN